MGDGPNPEHAADDLVARLVRRRWGLAVVAVRGGSMAIRLDPGDDPLTPESVFDIGSVTKTITGLLLGDCVVRGEASLDTTVGDMLDVRAGRAAAITLERLATHRSGLPRLPPNLDPAAGDPLDPYAGYDGDALLEALATVDVGPPAFEYSNFGFMLLGYLLSELGGQPFGQLARTRIFDPMGLETAACPAGEARLPGYGGGQQVPWWQAPLPGAGGVAMSITDLATYLARHLDRAVDGSLREALVLATTPRTEPPNALGLAWVHQGGGWWHNGGTYGFRSFVAFHPPTGTGVGLLANCGDLTALDAAGLAVLTEMARA